MPESPELSTIEAVTLARHVERRYRELLRRNIIKGKPWREPHRGQAFAAIYATTAAQVEREFAEIDGGRLSVPTRRILAAMREPDQLELGDAVAAGVWNDAA